jgi:mRNA-degrading endonuclease RelE of RelBE toxin-antitoxin system
MGSYDIRWKQSAERDLRHVDCQRIAQIIRAIESLSNEAFPPQHRKLRGTEELDRIRVRDYRENYRDLGRDAKGGMSNLKMRLRNYDLYGRIKRHYASIYGWKGNYKC